MASSRFWCGACPRDVMRAHEEVQFFKSMIGQGFLVYMQWSPEKGCSTGYKHWQIYLQFGKAVGLRHVRYMFGNRHFDMCNGSIEDNLVYCSPEGTCKECSDEWTDKAKEECGNYDSFIVNAQAYGVDSAGKLITQGYRSDLDEAVSRIEQKTSLDDIYTDPMLFNITFKNMKWAEKMYEVTHKAEVPDQKIEAKNWHTPVMDLLNGLPDLRYVYLVIGPPMAFKSTFKRKLEHTFKGRICVGSTKDHKYTKYTYTNEPIILYNWPNGTVPYLRGIEELVDGGLVSVDHGCTKQKTLYAHVLMFANFLPSKTWQGRKRVRVLFTFGEPKFIDLEEVDYNSVIFDDFIK